LGFLVSSLVLAAHAQTVGPVVVLIGVPGSGKAKQAATLKNQRSMTISADDLMAYYKARA